MELPMTELALMSGRVRQCGTYNPTRYRCAICPDDERAEASEAYKGKRALLP